MDGGLLSCNAQTTLERSFWGVMPVPLRLQAASSAYMNIRHEVDAALASLCCPWPKVLHPTRPRECADVVCFAIRNKKQNGTVAKQASVPEALQAFCVF